MGNDLARRALQIVLSYVAVGLGFVPAGFLYGLLATYQPLGKWSNHWILSVALLAVGFITGRAMWELTRKRLEADRAVGFSWPEIAFFAGPILLLVPTLVMVPINLILWSLLFITGIAFYFPIVFIRKLNRIITLFEGIEANTRLR